LRESRRFHGGDYEKCNSVQSSGNAPAVSGESDASIFYHEEGNAAFMLCLKIEVAVSFQMF
jgi:hypothetical protein